MTVHGTTFAFFVSGAFLFGSFCGVDLEDKTWDTPACVPFSFTSLIFTATLLTLLARGMR